jgi:hypothetical protein
VLIGLFQKEKWSPSIVHRGEGRNGGSHSKNAGEFRVGSKRTNDLFFPHFRMFSSVDKSGIISGI